MAQDVPERAAGAPSAAELTAAIERVSDGVLVLARDWTCTFINTAGGTLLGRTPAELIGGNIWQAFPEAVGSTFERNYQLALDTQQVVTFEEYFDPLKALFSIRTFPSPDGVTIYFQDVTELRRLEQERQHALDALREAHAQRRQFEALVEASSDFIAIADMDGRLRYLSPGARDLVGVGPDFDVTQSTTGDYQLPAGRAQFAETELPALLDRGEWSGETALRDRRGGSPIPVLTSRFVIRDPQTHEPVAFASVHRDISARKLAEERLQLVAEQRRELMDRLVVAQELERARIAADVHDDSVQALATVDLRLGMLQRKIAESAPEFNEPIRQLQTTLSGASDRLRELLFDLEPTGADDSLIDGLRDAAAHIFEDSAVSWSFTGDLAAELPHTERGQAVRVAKEAFTNVRKHANASTVTVTVLRQSDAVEVAITDNGPGLDPDTAGSAPGHRGLATMRDRAEIAGGWLRLEQVDPHGTTVRFSLPAEM